MATYQEGRWNCKTAYVLSSFPAFISSITGSTPFKAVTSIGVGAAVGEKVGGKISKVWGKSGWSGFIIKGLTGVVSGFLTYTALENKVNPAILDVEKRILSLCDCEVVDLENETKGMCKKLKEWFRESIYESLEANLGKCDKSNEDWKRIYYQAFIARKIYETYSESLGIKTYVLLIHRAILIKDESKVGPFNEKDINCYLYAMKFKKNDSKNILEDYMPNIYHYRMRELSGNDITLEYVSDSDIDVNSQVCRVVLNGVYLYNNVTGLSNDWLNCYSSGTHPSEVSLKDS